VDSSKKIDHKNKVIND